MIQKLATTVGRSMRRVSRMPFSSLARAQSLVFTDAQGDPLPLVIVADMPSTSRRTPVDRQKVWFSDISLAFQAIQLLLSRLVTLPCKLVARHTN
jgi:hypothetical protein